MTMTLLGAQMSQSEIDYMISVTDVDGDGLINYDGLHIFHHLFVFPLSSLCIYKECWSGKQIVLVVIGADLTHATAVGIEPVTVEGLRSLLTGYVCYHPVTPITFHGIILQQN
ncbi:hypothetical protein DPMN_101939 [Dreissena polymorpha]|uniref:EF-hand domain-containing protein n=1 Tax=Dreissena polymorpha TaxID=45954 RepID=A0A9D4LIK6_DREPO|nr:hypothetical protein DPMN_101939 [Dreissena polymorpha]